MKRPIRALLFSSLLILAGLSLGGPALAQTSEAAAAKEAPSTVAGRFVIKNVYGWGGIPGGTTNGGIYVTLYHPKSGMKRELTTDGAGYVSLDNAPAGIYVLSEITLLGESVSGPSRLTAPLTTLTCAVAPSSLTYCGTVVYTFQRLPEGKQAYTGQVQPAKAGVQGLDITDESEAARKALAEEASGAKQFKTSLWTGPKGLPTWEAASHFYQATEFAESRRYDKAIPEFKAGLAKDPEHAWAHFMLAKAYQWEADYDRAVAEYKKALRLQPDFAWAHYSLGVLNLLRADYATSREEFQKAAAIDPGFVPSVYYHLKKLEQMAKVGGTDLWAYKAKGPDEESFLADAKAAIQAALGMDWEKCFSYFSDSARAEAHCGICDPSSYFSVEELKGYLAQPIAKNFRLNHVKVRILSLEVNGSEAQVTFFNSYELAKTDEEQGWWFADISKIKARKADGRWLMTEHQYTEHLH